MSRCEEVREQLWPLDRPREVVEGEATARAHLEDCVHCQAFFDRDAALGRLLQRVPVAESVPPGLAARLAEALDRESAAGAQSPDVPRLARVRSLAPWAAVAAALFVAALGTFRWLEPSQDRVYVDAYLNRNAEPAFISTTNASAASDFFLERFGRPVVPVALRDGSLNRAVVCSVGGERSAMVQYEMGGHEVAHYRVIATSGPAGRPIHSATEDGVCVVRWSDGIFDHALVADIPEAELRVIAEQQFSALR